MLRCLLASLPSPRLSPRLSARFASVLVTVLALGGCATVASSGWSSVDALDLDYPRADGQAFFLYDGGRQPTARAVAHQGRIHFSLPADRVIGQCATVTDQDGRSILAGKRQVQLALRARYQAEQAQRQALVADARTAAGDIDRTRQALSATEARLAANPAHDVGACQRLAAGPLPPRPTPNCGSPDNCRADGAAICFTRYLGLRGCSEALARYGIPGLLSSPSCAASAARLANEKYDFDQAFIDALHGALSDAGRELSQSPDFGDRMMGTMVAAFGQVTLMQSAVTCTDAFVDRAQAPLRRWTATAEAIRTAPLRQEEACLGDLARQRELGQQLAAADGRRDEERARLERLDQQLIDLRQERWPLEWCGPRPQSHPGADSGRPEDEARAG